MARLLWLPKVLRDAGLTVVEVPGWQTRGYEPYDPKGFVCHDTGSASRTTTDAAEIGVMVNGRPDLPPPIGQIYLSRTGTVHLVASGRGNHAKVGVAGPCEGMGNTQLLGIEAQHAAGEPWASAQYGAYVRLVAALRRYTGWTKVAGHKEHQPEDKVDPSFDMDQFRRDVRAVMDGEDPDMLTKTEAGHLVATAYRLLALATLNEDMAGASQIPEQGRLADVPLIDLLRRVDQNAAISASAAPIDPAALAAELLAQSGGHVTVTIPDEQLERVIRRVLGGVDGATPLIR